MITLLRAWSGSPHHLLLLAALLCTLILLLGRWALARSQQRRPGAAPARRGRQAVCQVGWAVGAGLLLYTAGLFGVLVLPARWLLLLLLVPGTCITAGLALGAPRPGAGGGAVMTGLGLMGLVVAAGVYLFGGVTGLAGLPCLLPRAGSLSHAVEMGDARCVVWRLMVAAPDARGSDPYPLHAAARQEQELLLLVLLASDVFDVNLADAQGDTPLHLAVTHDRPVQACHLLAAGSDPERPNQAGITSRALATAAGTWGLEELPLQACG